MTVLEFKRKEKSILKHDRSQIDTKPPLGATAIGIDLGTTNSVVSLFYPDDHKPVTLEYENSHLVPSLIYYDKNLDKILVGIQAKKHLDQSPREVIKSTKKYMGKNSPLFQSNGLSYSAEETATLILGYLIQHPKIQEEEKKFGKIWSVITVPAHFDDAARSATLAAAEKAGICVLRIINEPTAAALAYSLISEKEITQETLAVFDFGGGTFDVTIVDRSEFNFQVLSSEGDIHLGGDDVDAVLSAFLLKKVTPPFAARNADKNSELYRKILIHAETIKKALQTEGSVSILDNNLDKKNSVLNTEVTREIFEEMISPVLEKTLFLTENAIRTAKRQTKNISRILLVGGSSRLNLIRKMLSDYFNRPVDARLEPDLAISWGACLQSAIILGISVDTILVDVCSHTLGVVVSDPFEKGVLKVAPILHRNTALPATKSEFFTTVDDNQNAVDVIVVQGENELANENRLIGSFIFQLQQPCPKGTKCEIQLTYDVNGMVHVYAKQVDTANEAKANFDSRTGEVKGWSQIPSTLPQTEVEIVKSDDALVINSVVIRAKRYLKKSAPETEEYKKISDLLKEYSTLLLEAQKGAQNDTELEGIEAQLLAHLEGN